MDEQLLQVILNRMDRIEEKLDILVEHRARQLGGIVVGSAMCTIIFQVVLAFIKH